MPDEPILKSHRRPDVATTVVAVGSVRFGDGSYPVIAGPVVIESEEQITEVSGVVADAGGSVLRAGTYRADESPYGFGGLGDEGLRLLERIGREHGLATCTEVREPARVEGIAERVDLLEIGSGNMQNFALLTAAGDSGKPILLKRGPAATIDEWLLAAEYILNEGNDQVILCERGIRTFEPRTADTLDISAVPLVQRMSHLPVIIDPTSAGDPDLMAPLALAGRAAGADGLLVEVHPDPSKARAGRVLQLDPARFVALMSDLGVPNLRDEIDRIDREVVELIARRLRRALEIAALKQERGLPLRSPEREAELLAEAQEEGRRFGLEDDFVAELFDLLLTHTRAAQQRAVGDA
jgi:3-deoxy-7-phosphoheptulonate synthase